MSLPGPHAALGPQVGQACSIVSLVPAAFNDKDGPASGAGGLRLQVTCLDVQIAQAETYPKWLSIMEVFYVHQSLLNMFGQNPIIKCGALYLCASLYFACS